MTQADISVSAFSAVTGRHSTRRFLSTPVPEDSVYEILAAASRAPSGQNMQPWLVHYVTGDTRARLSQEVIDAAQRGEHSNEYAYFPQQIREPYLSRRRKVGYDLFETYGVARDDLAGRKDALLRNFDFFGAPVGLFFVMERDWGYGAWIDLGMFMINVMTLAPAFGLATCAQQSWCEYGAAVRRVLPVAEHHIIVSGMALGFADPAARENKLRTDRVGPEAFVSRHI